jgi:3-phenylpropionate/trans-cinnamate dioxygenase ferredoxin subunit
MAAWKEAAAEAALAGVEAVGVVCEGKRIALFRLEDGIYAMDDVCSHEYSLLSEGEVWDGEVSCAKHGSRFNIRTGAVRGLPATLPVKTYPVRVEDGAIYVDLDGSNGDDKASAAGR